MSRRDASQHEERRLTSTICNGDVSLSMVSRLRDWVICKTITITANCSGHVSVTYLFSSWPTPQMSSTMKTGRLPSCNCQIYVVVRSQHHLRSLTPTTSKLSSRKRSITVIEAIRNLSDIFSMCLKYKRSLRFIEWQLHNNLLQLTKKW